MNTKEYDNKIYQLYDSLLPKFPDSVTIEGGGAAPICVAISVECFDDGNWIERQLWFGTADTVWAAQVIDENDDDVESPDCLVTNISSDSTDIAAITDAIVKAVQAYTDSCEPCAECVRQHGPHYQGKCDHQGEAPVKNLLNGCRIEYVGDVAFMRLPDIYAAPCAGGCNCGHKACTGKWDTLAIPLTPRAGGKNNYSYTVHRPETSA